MMLILGKKFIIQKPNLLRALTFISLFFILTSSISKISENSKTFPPLNTKEVLGIVNGLTIEAVVQSPSLQETPLQIVCLFEYTEGDIFNSPPALPKELNGMVHVDESLHGLVTNLRKSNQFEGRFLETLLINPPEKTISAKKLLLIGLGNRNDFKAENMRLIGLIGMREALRLNVASYSHASDLKDAGIDSPTANVAGLVVQGAIEAFRTQMYLTKQKASDELSVTKVSLLTGPAYFEDSKEGIKKVIATFSNQKQP